VSALRLGPASITVFLALSAGCAHAPRGTALRDDPTADSLAAGMGDNVRQMVTEVRAATARFRDIDSAVAAGYPREVARCYVDSMGAMGYHHVNRALADSTLDVWHPEILLYERGDDGAYRLTAVEYIVPYRIWAANSDSIPTVHGQRLHHVDEVNTWGLHVWAWKRNPAGLFANWNPDVHCPPGTPLGLR